MPRPDPNAPKQAGTVIVFKPGVTEAQAKAALEKLKDLVEYRPTVQMFNPEWGSPVWYIP